MSKRTTQPVLLNNGIFLQSVAYDGVKSHLDKSHVMSLAKGRPYMTDLGIIEPFITSGYIHKPYLYGFTNIRAERIECPGGWYKWSYPVAEDTFYIIEDLSHHDKPGIAEEKFKIRVNKAKYGSGWILAVDQHSPEQLLICEDEPINEGNSVVLTVKYVGPDPAKRWFPKEYLVANTKLFAIGTVETEWNSKVSPIPEFGGGVTEYMNAVGQGHSQIGYSITRDAAYTHVYKDCINKSLDSHLEILEMYMFKKGSHGHDISLQGQTPNNLSASYTAKFGGKKAGKNQMQKDIVKRLWVPKIEAIAMKTVGMSVEQKAIWGSGGIYSFDGKRKNRLPLGLFHQLNMGNKYTFNLPNFTIGRLEEILAERLRDRVEPFGTGYDITIKVGVGMFTLLRRQLNARLRAMGVVVGVKDVVKGVGKNNNEGLTIEPFQVESWRMENGYGTVSMELVPGLNPTDANEQINPKVTLAHGGSGHRLSAYMIIIEDITTNTSGNILELVHGDDWDYYSTVQVGKLDYMGRTTAGPYRTHLKTIDHPGYVWQLFKRDKAYFVKDITKSLLIKPINPMTGRAIYDGFFKA